MNHYLSDVINQTGLQLRITKRYPDSGLPPAGTPFALDVEVQTERAGFAVLRPENWFAIGGPVRCVDAVVVARGRYDHAGKIWAFTNVVTSQLSNCSGIARLIFDSTFRPDKNHWIRLEVFKERTSREDIESGKAEPIAATSDFLFDTSQNALVNAGVITLPTLPLSERLTNAVVGPAGTMERVAKTTRNITILALVGAGIYFTYPLWPQIQRDLKKALSK
ncbi:MAG: hypothetical protein LAT57_00135 [Balneolales bacterium]|nr:hypothetical protein [Balneolales bacterium]